ncbi:MAG TPA: hypothetical protein VF637_18310 [Sphingomicrobium sp.]
MKNMTSNVQRTVVATLLLVAVFIRMAWAARRGWVSPAGEAKNVAVALAKGRGFSDAYFVGSGPTAHLMPTTPLLAGFINWLVGPGLASEIALQVIASIEMVVGFLLLYKLFERLDVALFARLAGLAILCLLPAFLGQESLDFRYWEGGLAVILATSCLILIVDLDRQQQQPNRRQILALSLLFAITFFVSPSLGLGIGACALLLLFRKPTWHGRVAMGAAAAGMLLILLAPWVIRNDQTLGKPILLRSNMPLELALANNDRQYESASKQAFDGSMSVVHPVASGPGTERVTQIGEVAYMAELSQANDAWIARHPNRFAMLSVRHLRQMFFPNAFQFEIGSGSFSRVRAAWYSIVSAFGLCGIVIGIRRRRPEYTYLALVIAVVAITYLSFQPMARYLYLNYGLLVFCALGLLSHAITGPWQTVLNKAQPVA